MTRSDFSLPDNPTEEDIIFLEQYVKAAKKKLSATDYGTKNFYSESEEIVKDLIIYQPSDKKHNNFYMRYYVGGSKYKRLSLGTSDKVVARQVALETVSYTHLRAHET